MGCCPAIRDHHDIRSSNARSILLPADGRPLRLAQPLPKEFVFPEPGLTRGDRQEQLTRDLEIDPKRCYITRLTLPASRSRRGRRYSIEIEKMLSGRKPG